MTPPWYAFRERRDAAREEAYREYRAEVDRHRDLERLVLSEDGVEDLLRLVFSNSPTLTVQLAVRALVLEVVRLRRRVEDLGG